MIRICRSCGQVLPETDAEKEIAKVKSTTAKNKRDEAVAVWESFMEAHSIVNGFWERNPVYGVSVSIIVAMFAYIACLWPVIVSNDGSDSPVARLLVSVFVALLVFAVLGYFLVKRPLNKLGMHREAVRNAFVLRHKAQAECLGFTTYRS